MKAAMCALCFTLTPSWEREICLEGIKEEEQVSVEGWGRCNSIPGVCALYVQKKAEWQEELSSAPPTTGDRGWGKKEVEDQVTWCVTRIDHYQQRLASCDAVILKWKKAQDLPSATAGSHPEVSEPGEGQSTLRQ